jgi:ABC-type branched-subunit amino acid transport system substrate-binding protein
VNLAGASGPLRFDGNGDRAGADVQLWCVPPGSGGAVAAPAILSGVYFDDATSSLKGCYAKACGLAGDPLACP